ncbi:hypothetical protein PVK06_035918 [Gossypium arboreum]|uniref:Uncharacterized protein n=1 Tax=Gossypium arboreum TaxID=29729 RepID=A0ABR0NI46_GOSAR|nr:hypothetical protein PVK06_035918 [Gossypium arboreum]
MGSLSLGRVGSIVSYIFLLIVPLFQVRRISLNGDQCGDGDSFDIGSQPKDLSLALLSPELALDRERVGTSSRQKQKFTHTARSRSFACVAQVAEASSGQKVGRLQLFDITHRKKDGTPMTFEAAEIMEKLKDKKAEYEATASTDSSVNFEDIDSRIINEVLGPKRYVGLDFKDLVLTRPNILDPPRTNTCLPGVKVKLKFRG